MTRRDTPAAQRGAALLLAMIIVALIATAAAGMVWQQTRAVAVEAAQRAREDAYWMLQGALDWARLILREDLRADQRNNLLVDDLGEPWAQQLAEARLSSFLAADKDNNADAGGPEAFLSGSIEDAQSRFNLRGLVDDAGKAVPAQVAALRRLVDAVGAPTDTADRIALAVAAGRGNPDGAADAAIPPQRLSDLAWQGIEPATLERLERYVDLLPRPTPVNLNTAPREVVLAAIDGIDLGTAQRLVQARQRERFRSLSDVSLQLPPTTTLDTNRVGVNSGHFYVAGRLRLDDRVLEERSLLARRDNRVDVLRREKRSFSASQR